MSDSAIRIDSFTHSLIRSLNHRSIVGNWIRKMRTCRSLFILLLLSLRLCVSAVEINVDCAKTIGTIRPLHGGNSGPLNYGDLVDLTKYHKELKIPFTRLHDCHWPNPDVVDIHVVFP